jgi:ubiquinone/menaquinone biosynthesis C-methylase UbiE
MKTLSALLAVALTLTAQVAEKANSNYKTKEGRAQVAKTLTAPDRDTRQKPQELVAAMNLKPGMSVADIGTGVGYMLPYLSKAVGPGGKVYGQDIQTDFIDQAKARAATEKLTNVQFILGSDNDPKLPAGALDAALVLDVYHHFDYPEKMLAHIRGAIKPGGRLYIVDYYKSGGKEEHIRLNRDDAAKEIGANGFRLLSTREHIPGEQYMLVFERR